jgi:hypothetical protein
LPFATRLTRVAFFLFEPGLQLIHGCKLYELI